MSLNGFNEINDIDGDGYVAINYNSFANIDDGSCITRSLGCINSSYLEYDSICKY